MILDKNIVIKYKKKIINMSKSITYCGHLEDFVWAFIYIYTAYML